MALTLRNITKKIFAGYGWGGHAAKDLAMNFAKTCVVQPQGSVAVIADTLVIPTTHSLVLKATGSDAEALTIGNGKPGQILTIQLASIAGGSGVGTLTVGTSSTGTGWVTAAFGIVGDTLTIMWVDDTVGWIVLGSFGTTTSDAATVIALS